MFEKEDILKLERKIDDLTEMVRLISERQNSQYTDIMMILKQKEDSGEIDTRTIEELYNDVRNDVVKFSKASTSYIQRKFKLGYTRAAQLMDLLEERGVISEGDGSKPREVLIKPEDE